MGDCLGGLPELSANPAEPAMNPPSSPSTTQAIISSTTQISILPNVRTTTSHTQPHTSGHLHHTTTPSSNNSKKSKKSKNPHQITIPKRHPPIAKNMFPATNIRLKRPKKSPLSFQHHKTIRQLDHNTSPKSSSTTTTTKPHYSTQKPLPHNQLPPILPALSLSLILVVLQILHLSVYLITV